MIWTLKRLGQKSKNNFIGFLVQMRTRKFAFEINWPLVNVKWFREMNKLLPKSNFCWTLNERCVTKIPPKMANFGKLRLIDGNKTLFFSYKNILRVEHQKCVVHTGLECNGSNSSVFNWHHRINGNEVSESNSYLRPSNKHRARNKSKRIREK